MADRVNPHDSLPVSEEIQTISSHSTATAVALKPHPPSSEKPVPSPGTYIIKIPKDQIYRIPPPENARLYDQYTRQSRRQNRCCCCFCWLIGIIFVLIVLLGIAAGVMYLVFRPKALHYSIDSVSIKGMNLTSPPSSTAAISPKFNVTVRVENPNNKIGIRYLTNNKAEVYFNGARLSNGAIPAFYQPKNYVTVFVTALKGNGIELKSSDKTALIHATAKRQVPLTVKFVAPVKIKVGSVETWRITVKVDCDITVDQLTAQAKIGSKDCNYKVDIWGMKM